jgi:drug/metabolite transporter (DMT)-like permease
VRNKPSGVDTGLLIVATTLWGASSALLAELGKPDGTAAPLLAAGGAAALAIAAFAGPARRQISQIASNPRVCGSLVLIGLIEAINLGLYAAALTLGPVPVVVALHLTSPVLLVGLAVIRGHRRPDRLVALQGLLMVSGIALLAVQPAERPGSAPILAGVLAIGSAVAVAALIKAVTKLAPAVNPDGAAAVQLTIAAAATAPVVLVASPPDQHDAVLLMAAGALFLGPGFAIYWRALRGLSATTASIVGLNEAVAATILGYILFAEQIALMAVISSCLVLAAIVLEVIHGRRQRTSPANRGDKPG